MQIDHSAGKEHLCCSCPEPVCFGDTILCGPKSLTPRSSYQTENRETRESAYLCVLLERWLFSYSPCTSFSGTLTGIASNQGSRYPPHSDILHRNLATALRAFLAFAYFLPTYSALASASSLLFPPGQDSAHSVFLSPLTYRGGLGDVDNQTDERGRHDRSVGSHEDAAERREVPPGEPSLTSSIRTRRTSETSIPGGNCTALFASSRFSPRVGSPVPRVAAASQLACAAEPVTAGGSDQRDSRTASNAESGSGSPRRADCGAYLQPSAPAEHLSWGSLFPFGDAQGCKTPPLFSAHSQAWGNLPFRSYYPQNAASLWKLEASVTVSSPNRHRESKGRRGLSRLEDSTLLAAYASAATPEFSAGPQQQRGLCAGDDDRSARVAASLLPGLELVGREATQKLGTESQHRRHPSFSVCRSESPAADKRDGRNRVGADRRSCEETCGDAADSVSDPKGRPYPESMRTPGDLQVRSKTVDKFCELPAFSIPFGEGVLSCSVAFREDLAFAVQSTAEASGSALSSGTGTSSTSYPRPCYSGEGPQQVFSTENSLAKSAAEKPCALSNPDQQPSPDSPFGHGRHTPRRWHESGSTTNTVQAPQSDDGEQLGPEGLGGGTRATVSHRGGEGREGSQLCVPLDLDCRSRVCHGSYLGSGDVISSAHPQSRRDGPEAVRDTDGSRALSPARSSSQAEVDHPSGFSRAPCRQCGKDCFAQAGSSVHELGTDSAPCVFVTDDTKAFANVESPTSRSALSLTERNSARVFLGAQGTASTNDGDYVTRKRCSSCGRGQDAVGRMEDSQDLSLGGRVASLFADDDLLARRSTVRSAAGGGVTLQTARDTRSSLILDEGDCIRQLPTRPVTPLSFSESQLPESQPCAVLPCHASAGYPIRALSSQRDNNFPDSVCPLRGREIQSSVVGDGSPEKESLPAGREVSTGLPADRRTASGEHTSSVGTSGGDDRSRLEAPSPGSCLDEGRVVGKQPGNQEERSARFFSTEVKPSPEARARWGLLLQRAAPPSEQETGPASRSSPRSVIRCPSGCTLGTPTHSSASPALADTEISASSHSPPGISAGSLFLRPRQNFGTTRRRRCDQAVDWIQAEKTKDEAQLHHLKMSGGAGRTRGTSSVFTEEKPDSAFSPRILSRGKLSKADKDRDRRGDGFHVVGKNTVSEERAGEKVSARRRDRAVIVLDRDHEEEESDDDEESEVGSSSSLLGVRKASGRQTGTERSHVDLWSDWTSEEMAYEHYVLPSVSRASRRRQLVTLLSSLRPYHVVGRSQTGTWMPVAGKHRAGGEGVQEEIGETDDERGNAVLTKGFVNSGDWDAEKDAAFFSCWVSPDLVQALSYVDATRVPLKQLGEEDDVAEQGVRSNERKEERRAVNEEKGPVDEKKPVGAAVGEPEENLPEFSSVSSGAAPSYLSGFSLDFLVEEGASPPHGWSPEAWCGALESMRFGGPNAILESSHASGFPSAVPLCFSRHFSASTSSASAPASETRVPSASPGVTFLPSLSSSAPSTCAASSPGLFSCSSSSISSPSSSPDVSGSSSSCGSAVSVHEEECRLLSLFVSETQQDDMPFKLLPVFSQAGYKDSARRGLEEKTSSLGRAEVEISRFSEGAKVKEADELLLFSHLGKSPLCGGSCSVCVSCGFE